MRARDKLTAAVCVRWAVILLIIGHSVARAERLPIKTYTASDGLESSFVHHILQDSRGFIWFCTRNGLSRFDGHQFTTYNTEHGLPHSTINRLLETRGGVYWVATNGGGVCRFNSTGDGPPSARDEAEPLFTVYPVGDQPATNRVNIIYEDRAGRIWAGTDGGLFRLEEPGDQRPFRRVELGPQTRSVDNLGASAIMEDRRGALWVGMNGELYRLSSDGDIEHYTARHGLHTGGIWSLLEDSRGDLWLGSLLSTRHRLVRWERATETFHQYTEAEGLPPSNVPHAFCEDHAGNLWIGFYDGGVARYGGGRFTLFTSSDGWPGGVITNLFLDRAGRLWITSNQSGVSRIDDPTADRPKLINYGLAEGLSSNDARCVTEDQWGRIYVGTVRGVDRLDLTTGRIKHYTPADGLSADFVISARRDRRGWLWFGTMKGLSRLIPEPDLPASPPPVLITALRVAGLPYHISELGQTEAQGLEFETNQNQVQIDFTGLAFALGEQLRFRYKLEGADDDWNALTTQRTVNYASLRPGSYRFVVQAINADGHISPTPAVVAFTIRPPIWQRWWFVALTMALIGLGLYALYRNRLARLIEIERVRTRIAADLHDDIGSSLSQIAIISEVLHKQVRPQEQNISQNLSLMARVSREAVDSMSDIVWAINPQRDHLRDLVRRMRRFASETFPARDIDFGFHGSGIEQDIKLGADLRRQVFLIFKESVNNIVRHSGCTRAEVEVRIEGPSLVLEIADNGKGIDGARLSEGNGLMNMRKRAQSLGGELNVAEGEGGGTTIALRVPHEHRTWIKRGRNSLPSVGQSLKRRWRKGDNGRP